MSQPELTDNQLLAYFDEMLAVDEMGFIEQALRDSTRLQKRLARLAQCRDRGIHSVGGIWRNDRLSCPIRSQLGSYLLGTLDQTNSDYIQFHTKTIGCRICTANLEDMQKTDSSTSETKQRRQRFFQTSAGHLRKFSE